MHQSRRFTCLGREDLFQNVPKDFLTGAKRREWMGLGVAGMIFTSDEMDHSRKFPAKYQYVFCRDSPISSLSSLVSWIPARPLDHRRKSKKDSEARSGVMLEEGDIVVVLVPQLVDSGNLTNQLTNIYVIQLIFYK